MTPRAGAHPDEILTAAYLDGGLAPAARDSVEAHLASCDPCRAGVTLLRSGGGPATEDADQVPSELLVKARTGAAHPLGLSSRALAAAAILLLCAAGVAAWRLAPAGEPRESSVILRDPAEGSVVPPAPVSPGSAAVIPRVGIVFAWTSVPGADRYIITVLGVSGETIATLEAAAGQTSARWPSHLDPPPPGPLIWKVRAVSLDRTLAESHPVSLTVR